MRLAADCFGGWAWRCWCLVSRMAGRVVVVISASLHGTPRRCFGNSLFFAKNELTRALLAHFPGYCLGTRAKFGRRDHLIGEKVIGRDVRGLAARVAGSAPLVRAICRRRAVDDLVHGGTFALLHQPTRQHGRGVFFHPGIEKLRDLLAKICGMAEPREFVALQGVSRRREKKLPGWLRFMNGQKGLQGKRGDSNAVVLIIGR
jgi:hypothetical protein